MLQRSKTILDLYKIKSYEMEDKKIKWNLFNAARQKIK